MNATTIAVGDPLPDYVVERVDAEKMKTMALLLRDPNPIHWDVETVRELGMGDRPVNQGPNNMAYLVGMLADFAGGYDRVTSVSVRFLSNVSPAIGSSEADASRPFELRAARTTSGSIWRSGSAATAATAAATTPS